MFENCGSCFAAEQFVDIRLGAKYLLTLTSYYYEREWKFMAMITLQNSRNAEVTVLTNNFIDNYMPGANGEFVKVYIYLLRLLSDTSVPFSLEQMADHFFCTERDIIRALKYWEKEKLLTLTYRNNEDIAVRSYVMQPYTMVKDHRTNEETGNVDAVLDGGIDIFINAYLKWIALKK